MRGVRWGRLGLGSGGGTLVLAALSLGACGSSDFCSSHDCIGNFANGRGYVVQCADGSYSHSGGISGACSHHGGESVGAGDSGDGSASPPPPAASAPPPTPTPPPSPRSAGVGSSTSGNGTSGGGQDFCSTHTCIGSFNAGTGYIVQCADGDWSHSGGNPGACSHHGGETNVTASDGSGSGSSSESSGPTPPSTAATPATPKSRPRLVGPSSASAGDYSATITSFRADHSLDLVGFGGASQPEFGVALTGTCSEPADAIVTWLVHQVGSDKLHDSSADCINGSLDDGLSVTLSAVGCGAHFLELTPQEIRDDGRFHNVSAPLRFRFSVCR